MNITTTTIKAFNILLTEAELRAAIADPQAVLPTFKAALNGVYDNGDAPRIDGQGKRVNSEHPFRKSYKSPKEKPAGKSVKRDPCEVCGKPVAPKYMANHMRKKHANAAVS